MRTAQHIGGPPSHDHEPGLSPADGPGHAVGEEIQPEPADGRHWSPRTRLAVAAGNLAALSSRVARLGAGGMIGGRITLRLQPTALADLTQHMTTALITGTNGKTTTTAMLSRAVEVLGPVACNRGGANMPDGLVAAVANDPDAANGVFEIDEFHLPLVLKSITPQVVVLLNLSRDQIDRVGEVRNTERRLRAALADCPSATVVANCDDVMVTSIAMATPNPVWVSVGTDWLGDAAACPRCGGLVHDRTGRWWCECGLARPEPDWTLEHHGVRTPEGQFFPLTVGVPGPANVGNAAMAAAAASALGVPLLPALQRIGSVSEVSGRYKIVDCAGRHARLLLAKNPAGWRETLSLVCQQQTPVVLAINAHEADGRDLSWLWDVQFDGLAGRPVVVSGERAIDLAVRLTYAQIPHTVVDDPYTAITHLPPGPVDMLGNYTAFRDLTRRFADAQ
jgi:UDP-N-acetylmuramyl tripeptide synthase